MHFIIPKLDVDGKLSQADAFNIYNHYLTTTRIDFDGVKRLPTKIAVVDAMCKYHEVLSYNPIQTHLSTGGKIFFWSDQHFNHNNIIKYSNRPFEDKEHMNQVMIKNYFDSILPDDLVIWGGDVAFGLPEQSSSMLQSLPGKKLLILGNHDFDKNNFKFRNYHIFNHHFMCHVFYMIIDNKICNLLLSHYPIDNSILPKNTLNIHGHIHTELANDKNINICVEHTDYKPIDIHAIIKERFIKYC